MKIFPEITLKPYIIKYFEKKKPECIKYYPTYINILGFGNI